MIISTIKEGLNNIYSHYLLPFIGFVASFLTPLEAEMIAIAIIITFQFFTGVMASTRSGHKNKYLGWKVYLFKLLSYVMVIVLFLICEKVWTVFSNWKAASVVAGFLAMKELKMVIDNTSVFTGENLLKKLKDIFALFK